jgi:hypothetical protein
LGVLGSLSISHPANWKADVINIQEVKTNEIATFDGIRMVPTNAEACLMQIELIPTDPTNRAPHDIHGMLLEQQSAELSNTVETNLTLQDFAGIQTTGAYFHLTDRRYVSAPPPANEFKYLTRGIGQVGPLMLVFTFLSDDTGVDEALQVIKSARITSPPARQ